MSINDRDCEDTRFDFVATRINMPFLGHENGYNGDEITLPRFTGFGTNQYETRQISRTHLLFSSYYCKTWLITVCISVTYH